MDPTLPRTLAQWFVGETKPGIQGKQHRGNINSSIAHLAIENQLNLGRCPGPTRTFYYTRKINSYFTIYYCQDFGRLRHLVFVYTNANKILYYKYRVSFYPAPYYKSFLPYVNALHNIMDTCMSSCVLHQYPIQARPDGNGSGTSSGWTTSFSPSHIQKTKQK